MYNDMKKTYNNFFSEKHVIYISTILIITLFSGCKKNDSEINSGFLESKLSNEDSQSWYAPLSLSGDGCNSSSNAAIITFHSNHDFDFNHDVCATITGSWNASYTANRSGQILILNLTYMDGSVQQTESFSLRYSSEQDIFYALDPDELTLYPFEKYDLAP
jgi:hypothetical protein